MFGFTFGRAKSDSGDLKFSIKIYFDSRIDYNLKLVL